MVEQVKPKPTLWPLFVGLGLASVLGLGFLGLLAAAFYTGFHRSFTDGLYRASRTRGDAAYSRRDYQAAADAYGRMVELRPHAARGYGLRADCYFEMGRYTAAIADDTQAIRLGRGAQYLAQLHYDRGNGYEARQDFALAVADYTEALRLTPGDAETLQARVAPYQDLKDFPHAFQDADAVIAARPKRSKGFLVRAYVWQAEGNHARAAADFRRAIGLSPEDDDAYKALAQMYDHDGRDDEAAQVTRAELQARPSDAACWGRLGWWQYKAGNYAASVNSSHRALGLDNDLTFVWLNLGLCYAAQGDWPMAERTYTDVLPHCRPEDVGAGMNDLAAALLRHPAQDAAQQALQKSMTLLNGGRPVVMPRGYGRQAADGASGKPRRLSFSEFLPQPPHFGASFGLST